MSLRLMRASTWATYIATWRAIDTSGRRSRASTADGSTPNSRAAAVKMSFGTGVEGVPAARSGRVPAELRGGGREDVVRDGGGGRAGLAEAVEHVAHERRRRIL